VYEQGQPLNANLVDYRVPRFTDLPNHFESALIENHDGPGPYAAKGMGESGIVSIAPAVGNALYRATGARIRELPLTPERVWRALRQVGDKNASTAETRRPQSSEERSHHRDTKYKKV
jgi:CO/xanthine dehydrogenase Mo-binding subunit